MHCFGLNIDQLENQNHLKWLFPLCLHRSSNISLGPPVLSCVSSTFLSQKHVSDWKPEIRIPHNSEYVTLSGLDWNTEYEVHVVAENQQGKSEPGIISFRTATDPTTIPGTIPTIPPLASTHTSHSAPRLPPVTRKALLLFRSVTIYQVLIQSLLAVGSDMTHRSLSVALQSCIVYFTQGLYLFAESNKKFHIILSPK